jgi:hypothetical protein
MQEYVSKYVTDQNELNLFYNLKDVKITSKEFQLNRNNRFQFVEAVHKNNILFFHLKKRCVKLIYYCP